MTSVTIERRTGLKSSAAMKGPCVACASSPVALVGEQAIDGVSVLSGDRVLVKGQVDARENGIWIASTGNWVRSPDFRNNNDIFGGTQVYVTGGDEHAGKWFAVIHDGFVNIGTSDIVFQPSVVSSTSPVFSGVARNREGSYPQPLNQIITTAVFTDGSNTVTVPAGLDIRDGDTFRPVSDGVLEYSTYVVSGGGTTTLTLSRSAVASGSYAVQVGHNRWDLQSCTLGDTAGYRRLYVGRAARGRSTMQVQINGEGLDYQEVTAFAAENENGGFGGWFGARMSNENTGLGYVNALGTYCLIDVPVGTGTGYNRYEQSNLLPGTEPTSGSSGFLHVESSVESYWPTVDVGPHNPNPLGRVVAHRYDAGIGQYPERGFDYPNAISAFLDFVWNGAPARAGLVFGADALDTTGGRNPPVLLMAPQHALQWVGDTDAVAWNVFSVATTGYSWLKLDDGKATFGDADLAVSAGDGVSANVLIENSEMVMWSLGRTSTPNGSGNSGSEFVIARFDNSGGFLGLPLRIRRGDGVIVLADLLAAASYANDAAAAAAGVELGGLYRNGNVLQIRTV